MPCDPEELKHIPLFALLDDEEMAFLAAQVDLKALARHTVPESTGLAAVEEAWGDPLG